MYSKHQPVIKYNQDGLCVPYHTEPITKQQLEQLPFTMLALPYEGYQDPVTGEHILEPEFIGMTNAEVMHLKLVKKAAIGDLESTKIVLDRTLGKPKQQIEQVNLNLTYDQYLDNLASKLQETKENLHDEPDWI